MTYQSRLKSGLFISLDSRSVYAAPRAMTCVTLASNAALRDLGIMTIKAGTGCGALGGDECNGDISPSARVLGLVLSTPLPTCILVVSRPLHQLWGSEAPITGSSLLLRVAFLRRKNKNVRTAPTTTPARKKSKRRAPRVCPRQSSDLRGRHCIN